MIAVLIVLAVALAAAAVVIAVLGVRLARARRELDAVREQLRTPRALRMAGQAVRTVVGTAAQVHRQGVSEFLLGSIQDYTGWTAADRADIASKAAPDGTVTIVFSDIEGSTELNERLGDADWLTLLGEHDRLVRAEIERRDGHVVKTQGDGFMVVFGDPLAAIRAARGIQDRLAHGGGRRLRRTPVRVRIGMHVGEVTSRDGDYFGRNVALAARVAACADGGQILVSAAVHDALDPDEQRRLVAGDEVELKGLAGRHQLWVVDQPTRSTKAPQPR